ncbi:MAG TPA: septal ring lytic transglycosylase RlpA family protein [Methylovirgula sp.]|nr:septal ring lytic transglycosylase RlpA family protein [Methylovirgula sp.]
MTLSWSRFAESAAPIRAASVRLAPLAVLTGLALGGCAQQSQYANTSEYFPESVYGAASPRVVADGDPVPHGGGTYLVGRPYTIAGRTYYPSAKHYVQVGYASWYGDAFHGRRTANGEIYDRNSISAAHPTMPLPSYARVTNLRNHYSMIVRVNDRGPYAAGRIMDVSRRVADMLDFRRYGTTKVKVEYVGPASLDGSDDEKLMATMRYDGEPARFSPPTLLAREEREEAPVQTASASSLEANASDAVDAPPHVFNGPTPLPPSRPFDLGTIPGADVPIASRSQ